MQSSITVFEGDEDITLPVRLPADDPRIAALSESNRTAYLDMDAKMAARKQA